MTAPHHVDLGEYDEFVRRLFVPLRNAYTSVSANGDMLLAVLGLQEEIGEVSRLIKRQIRDGVREPSALKKELGDVCYWLTFLIGQLGFTLEEVIATNIAKLSDREKRGVIRGTGDNR